MRAVLIGRCHRAPNSMRKQKNWKDLLAYIVGDLSKKTAVLHFSGLVIVLKVNVSFFLLPV